MWIGILLGVASVGGIAYALVLPYFSGELKAESRQQAVVGKAAQEGRPASKKDRDAARRKQIESALDITSSAKRKMSLATRIGQAGLNLSESQYFMFCAGCGLVIGLLTLFISASLFMGLLGALIGAVGVPTWMLAYLRKKRLEKFGADFAGAIDVIVRGIKAGLPVSECIKIVGNEAPEPLATEFRGLVESQQMGMTMSEAVERMAQRIPTPEANFFAIVITVQQKTGGNLSEALGNLSRVLRERKKMRGKIRAMATEATASAAIIGSLPFIVTILIYVTSPDYIKLMWTTPTGKVVLVAAGMWMSCGIAVMRKMINFDF
jgi:tight adherence protein B